MSAALELRSHAQLFGWESHIDERRHEDTFLHGGNMITVSYKRDGSIDQGSRYLFYRINDVQLQETTMARNKKTAVVAWLANLGD